MTHGVVKEGQPLPSGLRGYRSRLAEWWGPRPWSQIAVILGVAAIMVWFGLNIVESLRRAGISPGFAFLERAANFQIGETPIRFSAGDTYLRAILVGLINTLKVAVAGCVLATLLGVTLGVLSLSGNPLVAGLVRIYVETIRNTPLLLQLFFWIALARNLPGPRQAPEIAGFLLSNRGVFVPWPHFAQPALLLALPAALAAGFLALRHLRRAGRRSLPAWAGLLAAVMAILFAAGPSLDLPELKGFNIRGGRSLSPEFAALLLALVVKFSAAISEIVRAGILSVPLGQREAARALGLSEGRIMRMVVLPQALRVIVPLITSSFLDLAKDSSLAVAIGYPDLVSVLNTTANTTGQAIEAVMIMTGSFLCVNLSVAWAMNRYNSRVALRGEERR